MFRKKTILLLLLTLSISIYSQNQLQQLEIQLTDVVNRNWECRGASKNCTIVSLDISDIIESNGKYIVTGAFRLNYDDYVQKNFGFSYGYENKTKSYTFKARLKKLLDSYKPEIIMSEYRGIWNTIYNPNNDKW